MVMEGSDFSGGVLADFPGRGKSIHAIETIIAGEPFHINLDDPFLSNLILYPASMGHTWRHKLEQ